MTIKDIVEIFNALLTPIIAIIAVYFARQQYVIQHKTFNVQLYERRYIVFKSFMTFFADIMRDGKISYQRLSQFYAEASEADYLFSNLISEKREEIYERGLSFINTHEKLYPSDGSPGLEVGSERTEVAQENSAHLKWFIKEIKIVKASFKSEMSIK